MDDRHIQAPFPLLGRVSHNHRISGDPCAACLKKKDDRDEILYELSHMDDRSVRGLLERCRHGAPSLYNRASEKARRRHSRDDASRTAARSDFGERKESLSRDLLESLLAGGEGGELMDRYLREAGRAQREEVIASPGIGPAVPDEQDIHDVLVSYADRNLIDMKNGFIRITPHGSRRLARHILEKTLEQVTGTVAGVNGTGEAGFGVTESLLRRSYEFGDEFWLIDPETTLLKAMERKGTGGSSICFDTEDLQVKETLSEVRLATGLIVDESGSMSGPKRHAAMDVALALAGLVRKRRRDSLELYLFAERARQVGYWEIPNLTFAGGTTDIREALKRFRLSPKPAGADIQAYLVTDILSNTEDGRYVGFSDACRKVAGEAALYASRGMTLNVIMVDDAPDLKAFASHLARRNLGRVFYVRPENLGTVVVEDYLKRREGKKGRKR